jgi:6-pyruvoyltetrahydropterin/6-carboxytetrahydropterin synthase
MKATFAANQLDERNWVVDFGGLKPFKTWLEDTFDHKLLIASDDPKLCHDWVDSEIAEVRILPATGCEAFARLCFEHLEQWLVESGYAPRVWLNSFEVMEHSGNSALIQRRFR